MVEYDVCGGGGGEGYMDPYSKIQRAKLRLAQTGSNHFHLLILSFHFELDVIRLRAVDGYASDITR